MSIPLTDTFSENLGACGVHLVGRAAVWIVIPACNLAFAIRQRAQITRRAVCVAVGGDAWIHFIGLPTERVVGVVDDVGTKKRVSPSYW
jgi:hypothetical protein